MGNVHILDTKSFQNVLENISKAQSEGPISQTNKSHKNKHAYKQKNPNNQQSHTYQPNSQEAETEGLLKVQGQCLVHTKLKANQVYERPCSQTKTKTIEVYNKGIALRGVSLKVYGI